MSNRIEILYKKKGLLKWFLNRYRLKEEKTRVILEYLLYDEEILTRVNFVEDLRPYPNAILISSEDAKTVSYLLRINGKYYENVDEFMEVLKTKQDIELYIWLAFDRRFICSHCLNSSRENQGMGFSAKAQQNVKDIERYILSILKAKQGQREKLLMAIDEALEDKNEEAFLSLTNQLKDLE